MDPCRLDDNPGRHELTGLLRAWSAGDAGSRDRIFSLLYEDLRRRAHTLLRGERPDHTLDATALVHEAYERLVDQTRTTWNDRAHFLAVAAGTMRRVLVDHARGRATDKRGAGWRRVTID